VLKGEIKALAAGMLRNKIIKNGHWCARLADLMMTWSSRPVVRWIEE
jgi:hypothetical protein